MLPTIMYDTVKFVLPAKLVEGGITDAIQERIAFRLQELEEFNHRKKKESSCAGFLNGWYIDISPSRLIVEGSFQKFVTGDQLTPMTPTDVDHGIRKLSELLGLPMELAIVYRLDVAINIQTERHPAHYFACLGEMTGK